MARNGDDSSSGDDGNEATRRATASSSLDEFIRSARTNESSHSHVLVGPPYGKINVPNSRLKEFWNCYCRYVANGSAPVYLAERPHSESPVLVDVDLKTRLGLDEPFDENRRIYDADSVKRIVATYQSTLRDEVLLPDTVPDEALTCVLLEKRPRLIESNNGIRYVKNGFHLHFPKLFTDAIVQEAYVVPIVKKRLCGLFDHLYTVDDGTFDASSESDDRPARGGKKPVVEHYDFIDAASIKVHWLMYGSRKPNNPAYSATACFDHRAEKISFERALSDYELPTFVGDASPTKCEGRVKHLLPRILSIRLHGRLRYYYRARASVRTPVFDACRSVREKRPLYVRKTVADNVKEMEALMPLINDERADSRSDWLTIGFCLWNITQGDDEGLSAWLEFSDRSDKYNEAECICLWNSMRENNFTIGTLKYFAKQDDPAGYEALCKRRSDSLIDMAVDGGHNDLAKILKNEYNGEFVYSTSVGLWYRFVGHVWKKSKLCFELSERISDNNGVIISQFDDHLKSARRALREAVDDDAEDRPRASGKRKRPIPNRFDDTDERETEDESRDWFLSKKIKTLEKLVKSCKAYGFKQSVMKECQEVFRDDGFSARLNTNPYVVAFKNGIFDFKNGSCFRAGKPEDYLSESLPIDYHDYGSVDHPEVMEVTSFFRKVLPDDDVRTYFFDQVSQLFIGGNHDKVILIWTGTGDNGKTVTQRLFEKMLGPLAIKISTSLVTGRKTKIGQAAPELARTGNGVRWVVMDEPDSDEQITTGLLKSITGNDSYWARDLYQGGGETKEIVPLYKIHMLCNKLPSIKSPDDAFWERIRVIPFESKFVDEADCPVTYEERVAEKIFPKDKQFSAKTDALLKPLAWFLISHWRGLSKSDRVVPEKVKIATHEYRQENSDNPFTEFFEEFIVATRLASVRVDAVWDRFKDWYRINYRASLKKKSAVTALSKLMGAPSSDKRWHGFAWLEDETR